MPTYTISAPDGNTYKIDGPEGATDEQVRAQVLKQHPTAGTKPQPGPPTAEGVQAGPPEPSNFTRDLGRALRVAPVGAFGLTPGQMNAAGSGIMDKVYGARQFLANQFGTEDPEELRKKIAQREQEAKALPTDERIAHTLGTVAPDVLAITKGAQLASKGVEMLPQLAKIPGWIKMITGGAAGGAALSPFQPTSEENYNAADRAATGAAYGVGGNVLGAGLGRVITPLTKIPDLVQEQVKYLRDRGAPMIAAMTTGNPMIESLSHAFEKLPFSGIPGKREAFKDWMTRKATGMAGTEMPSVGGGSVAADIMAKPQAQAEAIRALPNPIPLTDVPAAVTKALNDTSVGAALAGRTAPRRILTNTRDVATNLPSITADEFMTAREELARLAYNSEGVQKTAYKEAQDALEASFKKANPNIDLDKWKTQYGRAKDIETAAPTGGGQLDPEKLAAQLPKSQQVTPTNEFSKLAVNSAARFNPAPGGENRSALTRLLLTGALSGGAGAAASDNKLEGFVTGLAVPFGISKFAFGSSPGGKYLGNTVLDAQRRAYLRRLIMGASIGQE